MPHLHARSISTIVLAGIASIYVLGAANANADPTPAPDASVESVAPIDPASLPVVTSESGVSAIQLAPAGASREEKDRAIAAYEAFERSESSKIFHLNSEIDPFATGDYYFYCEEGSSGLMPWTEANADNCYGWFYRYLDGYRVDKVNMLKLKADNGPPFTAPDLNAWCSNNSFYCTVAVGAGFFLLGLLD